MDAGAGSVSSSSVRRGVLARASVWRLLTGRLGWSLQRPERRAVERDESEIAGWVECEWPRIKMGDVNTRAWIVLIGESGVSVTPRIRRRWSCRGPHSRSVQSPTSPTRPRTASTGSTTTHGCGAPLSRALDSPCGGRPLGVRTAQSGHLPPQQLCGGRPWSMSSSGWPGRTGAVAWLVAGMPVVSGLCWRGMPRRAVRC
ncbi:winged helix-turn-helix domain-containing protein [Streptomyces zhihengii]|uniref:winged helix-turn-helix domain-containing protein n=1 Tax=Streptomyces zhihengii TaxID=1818004 RepID=UPI0033B38DC8